MSFRSSAIFLLLLFISTFINLSYGDHHPHYRSELEVSWVFNEWLLAFDKTYESPLEREKRFEIFKDNLRYIDEHNDPGNNYTYTLGLNSLADLSYEEYQAKYLFPVTYNTSLPGEIRGEDFEEEHLGQVANSVDWRLKGSVSEVVNQQLCGKQLNFFRR